jgi:hypothetical protein
MTCLSLLLKMNLASNRLLTVYQSINSHRYLKLNLPIIWNHLDIWRHHQGQINSWLTKWGWDRPKTLKIWSIWRTITKLYLSKNIHHFNQSCRQLISILWNLELINFRPSTASKQVWNSCKNWLRPKNLINPYSIKRTWALWETFLNGRYLKR